MKTRKILTVSEKFKGLNKIDRSFINIIHRDLPNSDTPIGNYPAIFRSLSQQYQSLCEEDSNILTVVRDIIIFLNSSEVCLYEFGILIKGPLFLKDICDLILMKSPANNFKALRPTLNSLGGRLKELEFYTEELLPEMARNWVDKNKVGELSIYSRDGYLLVDYLKSLINKKWEELNGKDTIKL